MRDLIEPIVVELIEARAPSPVLVSQRSSLATLGIPPRNFLELVRRDDCPVRVQKLGKLRLVEVDAFKAWLRRLDDVTRAEDARAPRDAADEVLLELGLLPRAGGGR